MDQDSDSFEEKMRKARKRKGSGGTQIAASVRDLRRYEWKEIAYLARDFESQWLYHVTPAEMTKIRNMEARGHVHLAQKRVSEGEFRLMAILTLAGQRAKGAK